MLAVDPAYAGMPDRDGNIGAVNRSSVPGSGGANGADDRPRSPSAEQASHAPPDAQAPEAQTSRKRRRLPIEFIHNKNRRHITFSKRKAGIMKKAYELSTLTGTEVMLLVASETGHVYTYATPKLQPLITEPEGKQMIQRCLNSPDASAAAASASAAASGDDARATRLNYARAALPLRPSQYYGDAYGYHGHDEVDPVGARHAAFLPPTVPVALSPSLPIAPAPTTTTTTGSLGSRGTARPVLMRPLYGPSVSPVHAYGTLYAPVRSSGGYSA